jgi:Flp pilus assembly pilin Flp
MKDMLVRLWHEEEGQDLTEYALVMALVVMVVTLSIKLIGQAMSNHFSNSAPKIASS